MVILFFNYTFIFTYNFICKFAIFTFYLEMKYYLLVAYLLAYFIPRAEYVTMMLLDSSVLAGDVHYYQHYNRSVNEWHKEARLLKYLLNNYNPNIIAREANN